MSDCAGQIEVGEYRIFKLASGGYILSHNSGESMGITTKESTEKFEKLIADYFTENF